MILKSAEGVTPRGRPEKTWGEVIECE